jgi:hypothetical protein
MTICTVLPEMPEKRRFRVFRFPCGSAPHALRKPRKIDRFGALDDLRRH